VDSAGIESAAQHVDLTRIVWKRPASAPKDREEQTQHNADDDAGDDWEIKSGMFALNPNIAWQMSQPFGSKAAPQNCAEQNENATDQHQEFSQLAHYREGCANWWAAQG
jgi:hypothetical protein